MKNNFLFLLLSGGFKVADVKTYKIAVMPGDGTGPEVVNEGKKVLEAVGKKYGLKYEFTEFDFGGERYLKTGETLTESGIEELRKFKAIYLGAIGHPGVAPGILELGILLKARFALDQEYAVGIGKHKCRAVHHRCPGPKRHPVNVAAKKRVSQVMRYDCSHKGVCLDCRVLQQFV